MAYSKVIVNDKVIIDLENDTVDAGHLVAGYTAHDASGEVIVGSLEEKSISDISITNDKIVFPPGVYSKPITITLNYDDGEMIAVSPDVIDDRGD